MGVKYMEEEGNIFEGLFWGILFSIPLWMSLIGWYKILFKP